MNDDLVFEGNTQEQSQSQADMALLSMAFFFISLAIILVS